MSFKSKLCPFDLKYKQEIIKGIQEHYQFSSKIEDLESVIAPCEMRHLLRKFKP